MVIKSGYMGGVCSNTRLYNEIIAEIFFLEISSDYSLISKMDANEANEVGKKYKNQIFPE